MSIINELKRMNYCFIRDEEMLKKVIEENRLAPVLVRCNNGRFTCPAQDVLTFTKVIMESKELYVRDISLV